jgi:NAD kinase
MAATEKIAFLASDAEVAQQALADLSSRHGNVDPKDAEVIVALGGDGFMLQTLHATQSINVPVYGMNCGTIGFMMNEFSDENLAERLADAEEEVIHPLRMRAFAADGTVHEAIANLNGEFAIVIANEQHITIAKDCFGTKPLYFYGSASWVTFCVTFPVGYAWNQVRSFFCNVGSR